jgi:FMN reductase
LLAFALFSKVFTSLSAPFIVGLGGALRPNSSTEKAIRLVLAEAERLGAITQIITGEALNLPLYAPDQSHRGEAAQAMVRALARADGIIIGSPGYHGSISGVVKNALDYAEDLRGDPRPYFSARAVGCIATAGGWPGAVNTLGALRDIVHALRGWPTPLGAAINTADGVFDAEGNCTNARTASMLATIAQEVLHFAERQGHRPAL